VDTVDFDWETVMVWRSSQDCRKLLVVVPEKFEKEKYKFVKQQCLFTTSLI
jgi:hypothetical protein